MPACSKPQTRTARKKVSRPTRNDVFTIMFRLSGLTLSPLNTLEYTLLVVRLEYLFSSSSMMRPYRWSVYCFFPAGCSLNVTNFSLDLERSRSPGDKAFVIFKLMAQEDAAFSHSPFSSHDNPYRFEQDLNILLHRPVLYVFPIQTDYSVKIADLAASADLPKTGNTRLCGHS